MTKPAAKLVSLMESLADPTRLRLLRLLERNELSVVDLCDILQLPQSTVSRHLKTLLDQHWASTRTQGPVHLYKTNLEELEPLAKKLWLVAREQTDAWATTQQDQLRLVRRLRDKQNDSESFFASAANQWDKLRAELYGDAFTHSAMLALLPSDYIIADLGCGTGQVAAELAPHVKKIIAADSSAAMLKAAKKRLRHFKNIDLRRADLTSLPIPDASVDAALLLLVLTYAPSAEQVLKETARILKPTGRVIIVDLLPHDREDFRRQMGQQLLGFSPDSFKTLLATCGFTHPTISPLPPQPNTKGPALFLATAHK